MAGASRGGQDKYHDPNSWLGKLLLGKVESSERRIAAHCKGKKILTEKVKNGEKEYFGGHLIPKK